MFRYSEFLSIFAALALLCLPTKLHARQDCIAELIDYRSALDSLRSAERLQNSRLRSYNADLRICSSRKNRLQRLIDSYTLQLNRLRENDLSTLDNGYVSQGWGTTNYNQRARNLRSRIERLSALLSTYLVQIDAIGVQCRATLARSKRLYDSAELGVIELNTEFLQARDVLLGCYNSSSI